MKSRPIARRDMSTRSPREAVARVALLVYLLSPVCGLAGLAWGVHRQSAGALTAGTLGLGIFVLLHVFARSAWDFAGLLAELKRNPFKPERRPDAAHSGSCTDNSCGLL